MLQCGTRAADTEREPRRGQALLRGPSLPSRDQPVEESKRLESLLNLDVLDSAPEREFDALVAAAALVCDVPISLVSLIDSDRQWFKANHGLTGVTETARDVAFCTHAIADVGILEIPDARNDARFADNPLVTGAPDIRFYAGAPLRLSSGASVGTLCVIDREPRTLTAKQRAVLAHLAEAAAQALESRQKARAFLTSEARFRTLSESSPLGVFATDAEGGYTYTNGRWQEIYGLSADEATGTGWSNTLHPDDRQAVFAEWQRTAAERLDFDMEFRVQRADGSVRHVRSMSRPILDHDGRVTSYVGSVTDVTDRNMREVQLRRSEQLLNRTGELADVGGWELDLATGALMWSTQTCRIHGVPDEYQPRLDEAINFYAPEARPVIEAAVAQAIADGSGWDLELPFIQASGARIWVRAVGYAEFSGEKPVRLLGAFQNVTQRVEQRRDLETTHDRMSLATESGGIGVWDFDVRTGELLWDPRMYHLYGLSPSSETAAYGLWLRHLHPDDRADTEEALRLALAGTREFRTEFRIIWENGSVHHLRAAARVTRDDSGAALRMVGVNWDVTSLHQLAAELADQHELLRVTLQSIGDAVITTDGAGCVTWLNPIAERMTGLRSADAIGMPLTAVFHIVHSETREPAINPVTVCLGTEQTQSLAPSTVLISRAGEEYGIEDSAAPIRSAQGTVLGAVLVFHDVTEQRRLTGEMSHRAAHDVLTGLLNRTEFENRLQRTLDQARENGTEHAMLFIDLDQFKLVNDTCGHSVGDMLLQQIARLLTAAVRGGDIVARVGGDEFAVILPHCTSEQAHRVAQQICDSMDDYRFVHDGRRFRIGTSIGLVPVDSRWATIATALQAADTSCYAAKDAGRNRVHAWFESDHATSTRHGDVAWAARLEEALDQSLFVLHAQRIETLGAEQHGLHAEVLIRMQEVDGTLIPPGAFLPAAERFHLATRVDRWVLQHVLDALSTLPDLARVHTLCVNVSGQSIGDRAFHRQALAALATAGRGVCERLCLEITETTAATNMADASAFIEQVRTLGVRIALDDFGAGASSFGYLKTLAVDMLKIDGQFIKDLLDDPLDDAAVRCFVDVARVVGVKTVAEFVETPEVHARVRELGIDFAQGFLLHRPEPLALVLDRVVRRASIHDVSSDARLHSLA